MRIILFIFLTITSSLTQAQHCPACTLEINDNNISLCAQCQRSFHHACLSSDEKETPHACPLCGTPLAHVITINQNTQTDKQLNPQTDNKASYCTRLFHWCRHHACTLAKGATAITLFAGVPLTVLAAQTISPSDDTPYWSYIVADSCSVYALLAASGAPVIQLIRYWQEYLKTGAVKKLQSNTWLAMDFCGRLSIIGMLLTQQLVQNIDLSLFNYLTPGSALTIEIILIGSILYFRLPKNSGFTPLDDQSELIDPEGASQ